MIIRKILLIAVILLPVNQLFAADEKSNGTQTEPDKDVKPWKGGAELGFLTTRGNTNTESLNAKFNLEHHVEKWTHQFKFETVRSENNGKTTADRITILLRSQYDIDVREFMFASLRYDDDPFSGYDRRTTEALGYGYQLIENATVVMDVEAGLGARQTRQTDNVSSNEAIVRLASHFLWNLSRTSTLSEVLFVEMGDINTVTNSTTELKVRMNTSLALKLSLKVKDNSDVPAGKKHTDTQTAITLVYDF